MKTLQNYHFIKALRPFSLSVAIIACGLGILIAWYQGHQHWDLAFWIMLGGILAQVGINLINDIEDLSQIPDGHTNIILIKKLISRNTQIGIACFVLASIIGLYLVSIQGWSLFIIIIISAILSLSYNMGPLNFKHRGLAIVQVFLLMGIVMVQGAYLAMSGQFSVIVLLHSIPVSLLVSLLLLSNELRDWEEDKNNGVHTLTVRIGYQNAVRLYWLLVIISYLLPIIFFFLGLLSQLIWLLIPLLLLLPIKRYLGANDRSQLTPMTGRFFFLYGIAYLLALEAF